MCRRWGLFGNHSERLLAQFAKLWNGDLKSLSEAIKSGCPDWSEDRDTLCSKQALVTGVRPTTESAIVPRWVWARADTEIVVSWNTDYSRRQQSFGPSFFVGIYVPLVKQLVDNADYRKIGPLCTALQGQLKIVKSLRGDFLDAAVLKNAQRMCDFGVETVAYTFFLWNVLQEWPRTLKALPVMKKAVKDMRADMAKTKAALSEEMEKLLEQWESGEMFPDAIAARKRAAGLLPADADAQPALLEQPAQPGSVPPSAPSVTADDATAAAAAVPQKRGMGALLKAAKRTKVSHA